MFTAFIDDSGTDPNQKVAIASALVIPASKLIAFQSEWETLRARWSISDFHSSECASANKKSDMAGWDSDKIRRTFARIRQVTRKYGVRAYSLAVRKDHYESVIPSQYRERITFGHFHYTYAVQNLLSFLDSYACNGGIERPVEYVFDSMGEKTDRIQRKEIESALARMELARPGRFDGHYSFGKRKDHPGLQCVDLVAWTCYRASLKAWYNTSMSSLQEECYEDFSNYRNGDWLTAIGQTKNQLQTALESLRTADLSRPLQVRATIL